MFPSTGNPDGDINIVEWFDYNCPYCRKIAPEIQPGGAGRRQGPPGAEGLADPRRGLEVRRRGWRWRPNIRTNTSPAHEAMIGVSSKLTEPRIRELLAGAGIDMDRLNRDLDDQRQGDRRHPRPQPRSGGGVRLQGHAVLHRRQVPRAGHPDHGAIRDGDCRRAQGEEEQLAIKQKGALVSDEGA